MASYHVDMTALPSTSDANSMNILHRLAVNGEKSKLESLLKQSSSRDFSCDVDEKDKCGRTALVYTVLGDWYECAEVLLRHGATLIQEDCDKRTPIHWAAYLDKPRFLSLFMRYIEGAVDWNAFYTADLDGRTPLHYTAAHQSPKCLRLLLKCIPPSKLNVTDNERKTVLHWCVYYGNLQHVKLLINSSAKVHLRDAKWNSLLHLAVASSNPHSVQIVRLLLKKNPYYSIQKDIERRTALHIAVANESEETVRELCAAEMPTLNELDKLSRSPLHYAVLRRNLSIVRILVSRGASLYKQDTTGATALHYAAKNNSSEIVQYFLCQKNLEDTPDKVGRTALMWAASEGSEDVLALMLKNPSCFNVHTSDKQGLTALHCACSADNERCVEMLINGAADVSQPDAHGQTALFKACKEGHLSIVKIIFHMCPSLRGVTAMDEQECRGKKEDTVEALEEKNERLRTTGGRQQLLVIKEDPQESIETHTQSGIANTGSGSVRVFSVDEMSGGHIPSGSKNIIRGLVDADECTPLHYAAYAGYVDVCRWLLAQGVDPGKKDLSGRTALHGAAFNGHLDCMELILSQNARRVNDVDKEGYCALHRAAMNGHLEAVKMLFVANKELCKCRVKGSNLTPLDCAIAAEQQDVTQFLFDNGAKTIAGLEEWARDTIQRYLIEWVRKRRRAAMKALLERREKMTSEDNLKHSKNHASPADDVSNVMRKSNLRNQELLQSSHTSQDDKYLPDREVCGVDSPIVEESSNENIDQLRNRSHSLTERDVCNLGPGSSVLREQELSETVVCHSAGLPRDSDCTESMMDAALPLYEDFDHTALFDACRCGNLNLVNIILSKKADLNPRDENGSTPLHVAALHGHDGVCRRLLELGAVVNKRDIDGRTPLHNAILNGHLKCASLFLEKQEDLVSCLDCSHRTALHYAKSGGNKDVVKLLMRASATFPEHSTMKPSKNLNCPDLLLNREDVTDFMTERRASACGVTEGGFLETERSAEDSSLRHLPASLESVIAKNIEEKSRGNETDSNNWLSPRTADDGTRGINDNMFSDVASLHFQKSESHENSLNSSASDSNLVSDDSGHSSDLTREGGNILLTNHSKCLPRPPTQNPRNNEESVGAQKQRRAPDFLVCASEKERILRLRRDWDRITLVRQKTRAATVIQRYFRQYLKRKKKLESVVHCRNKTTKMVNKVSGSQEKATERKPPRVKIQTGKKPNGTPLRAQCSGLVSGMRRCRYERKDRFKSCFPLLSSSTSLSPDEKTSTSCRSKSSAVDKPGYSCRSRLTTNEIVEQWLREETPPNGPDTVRRSAQPLPNRRRRLTQNGRGSEIGTKDGQSVQSCGLYRECWKSDFRSARTTGRYRSESAQGHERRLSLTTEQRHLSRDSLARTAYASAAAVSYNFALATYHPLASRRGCKQASFPFRTSSRVRPNSMKCGPNGWVHTTRYAQAMASSDSSNLSQ